MTRTFPFLALLFLPLISAQAQTTEIALPLCSAAVHDRYMATGPDGVKYPTWHPQIDPQTGCRFDHEHGSNPDLVKYGIKPLFGYSSSGAEGHAGYKVYVLTSADGRYRWMLTHHFGTGNKFKAACVRRHTTDVLIFDTHTLSIVADLHHMGDYGKSVENQGGAWLTPPDCPDQAQQAQAAGSNGIRMLPVATSKSIGYEPWRIHNSTIPLLGWTTGAITFNTPDAQTACNDPTCSANVQRFNPDGTPAPGVYRFIVINNAGMRVATPGAGGMFYCDVTGTQPMQATDAGAKQQYLAPGLDALLPPSKWRPTAGYVYDWQYGNTSYPSAGIAVTQFITGPN